MKKIINDYILLSGLNEQYSRLILETLKEMNSKHEILLNSSNKKTIATSLDFKIGTINNMITRLVDVGILVRKNRGIYSLCDDLELIIRNNPDKFKIVLCYEKEQRSINIEIGGDAE